MKYSFDQSIDDDDDVILLFHDPRFPFSIMLMRFRMSFADTLRTRRSRLGDDGGSDDPEEGRREARPLGQWALWGEAASWWTPVCDPVDDISWSIAPFVRRW